jgi:Mg2+ and Co2+ transporter CorA
MKLENVENYTHEIEKLDEEIEEIADYVKKYPEKQGVKGNLETLQFIQKELIDRRETLRNKEDNKIFKKIKNVLLDNNIHNDEIIREIDKRIKETN